MLGAIQYWERAEEEAWGQDGERGQPTSQFSARLWLSSPPTPSWVKLHFRLIIMAPSSDMSLYAEVISKSGRRNNHRVWGNLTM